MVMGWEGLMMVEWNLSERIDTDFVGRRVSYYSRSFAEEGIRLWHCHVHH